VAAKRAKSCKKSYSSTQLPDLLLNRHCVLHSCATPSFNGQLGFAFGLGQETVCWICACLGTTTLERRPGLRCEHQMRTSSSEDHAISATISNEESSCSLPRKYLTTNHYVQSAPVGGGMTPMLPVSDRMLNSRSRCATSCPLISFSTLPILRLLQRKRVGPLFAHSQPIRTSASSVCKPLQAV